MTEHTIEMGGLHFLVEGKFYKGKMWSREEPPEAATFEIYKVTLGGFDVTEFLDECYQKPSQNSNYTPTKFDELEDLILDKFYG